MHMLRHQERCGSVFAALSFAETCLSHAAHTFETQAYLLAQTMLGQLIRHTRVQQQCHTLTRCFAAFGSTMPSPTKLEAIVNMDKMLERSPDQIAALWQEVTLLQCLPLVG